jgi:hypothetical protein
MHPGNFAKNVYTFSVFRKQLTIKIVMAACDNCFSSKPSRSGKPAVAWA